MFLLSVILYCKQYQKLDSGNAWEQGYNSLDHHEGLCEAIPTLQTLVCKQSQKSTLVHICPAFLLEALVTCQFLIPYNKHVHVRAHCSAAIGGRSCYCKLL